MIGTSTETGEFTTVNLHWKPSRDDTYAPGYQVYASTIQGFTPSSRNLVGAARTPGFTHDPHQVNQTWYYRIRAKDAAGRVGPFSAEVSATTGRTLRFEAEALLPPKSTTAPVQVQGNCCGVTWSGNAQLWFTPTTPGGNVVVEFEIPATGTYEFTTRQTLARDYGINTLAIDGARVGSAFDAYNSPDVKLSEVLDYGSHRLTVGTHTLTLAVPDKNALSVSYMAGLDYLQFRLAD